ncbi:MAG: hypothetical protein J6S67_23535 [Methanobrevibacter sp.]|nr:hypothetical protein [Methanobrevibacter sp.]
MAYDKYTWEAGDTVTAGKLNHIENGIEEASQTKGANILNVWIGQNEAPKSVNNGVGPYSLYYDEELTEKICDAWIDTQDSTVNSYQDAIDIINELREIFEPADIVKIHYNDNGDIYTGEVMFSGGCDAGNGNAVYSCYIYGYGFYQNYPPLYADWLTFVYYENQINA